MNFGAPTGDRRLTFEQRVQRDTERLRWKMEKTAQRRKATSGGFLDEETVIPPKSTVCIATGCDRKVHALGLCSRDYKRTRRDAGLSN